MTGFDPQMRTTLRVANILVIIDPTASEHPVLDKALRLAQACDARLELLACETRESRSLRHAAYLADAAAGAVAGGSAGAAERGFIVNLRRLLEELAQPARRLGIDVTLDTASGDPLHRLLLERIKRGSADLVMKDTHHHALLQRTFMTHTDWHLIRGCPVPLLLVKSTPWPQPASGAPVLAAALDPGHPDDRAGVLDHHILDWVQWLAQRLGTTPRVLHAFLPLVLTAETVGSGVGVSNAFAVDATRQALAARRRELEEFIAQHGLAADAAHLRLGVASQVLPALARELQIDVLTVGAISRSGLRRLFIGSTAERVLEHLPCDVLVMKSPDFTASS